jgi:hypothetical protein
MSHLEPTPWLPRFLFWLTLGIAAVLISLVLFAPLLDNEEVQPHGWSRLVRVFAQDVTLRRTAIASALGLMTTACVFFRTPSLSRRAPSHQPRLPPPSNMAGA